VGVRGWGLGIRNLGLRVWGWRLGVEGQGFGMRVRVSGVGGRLPRDETLRVSGNSTVRRDNGGWDCFVMIKIHPGRREKRRAPERAYSARKRRGADSGRRSEERGSVRMAARI